MGLHLLQLLLDLRYVLLVSRDLIFSSPSIAALRATLFDLWRIDFFCFP
jgi:hypothetical protein